MTRPNEITTLKNLQVWLTSSLPHASNLKVSPLNIEGGGGYSAEMFMIAVDFDSSLGQQHKEIVIRRQSRVELFLDADLERQGKIIKALNTHTSIPVPEFIGVEMDPKIIGEPFLAMSRVDGNVVVQNPNYNQEGWLAELQPEQRATHWKCAIEAFAELHKIDWQKGFQFLNKPEYGANGFDQFFGWFEAWHIWTAENRSQPIADSALSYLKSNKPTIEKTCVLWGDPHQSNIIFNPNGSVAALIDWELGSLGTPEIDLAFWLYFDEMWGPMSGVKRLKGLPDRNQVIAIYEEAAGYQVKNIEYFEVLASLRFVNIIRKCVDRLISEGKIPATTSAATHNIWTQHLARLIGEPEPQLTPDFYTFLQSM